MSGKRNSRLKKARFDFFDFMEARDRDQLDLLSSDREISNHAALLGQLAHKANNLLDNHGFIHAEVTIPMEIATKHCQVATLTRTEDRQIFIPFEPERDEDPDELIAEYLGLDVVENIDSTDEVAMHTARLVHRLLITREDLEFPFYTSILREYSVLPIEYTNDLEIIESSIK